MHAILRDPAFSAGYGFLSDRRLVSEAPTTDFVQGTLSFLKTHQSLPTGDSLGRHRQRCGFLWDGPYGPTARRGTPLSDRDIQRCREGPSLVARGRGSRTRILRLEGLPDLSPKAGQGRVGRKARRTTRRSATEADREEVVGCCRLRLRRRSRRPHHHRLHQRLAPWDPSPATVGDRRKSGW
jgi:hypothetical protein